MLTVTQSNRIEALAEVISGALPAGDPFARPRIVVAGRLVGRWLQYALARRRGVAGALRLPFLEPFLVEAFTGDAAARDAGLRAIDRAQLAALCASAFADAVLINEAVMAPVRGYLDADGGSGDDVSAVRRVQLAARAAGHLWDYALTRPGWLDAWDAGEVADTGEVDVATLGWQRRLYEVVCGAQRRALVPRLVHARKRIGLPAPVLDGPVHVVGFSYLPKAHVDALGVLATSADVHVALVTPCAEYWEDVPARRRRTETPEPHPNAPPEAADPLALMLWGAPGRDTATMLVSATEGAIDDGFVVPERTTALAAWSRDLLRRSGPSGVVGGEAGVTVLACPSVSRELEIVGSEIWRLLRAEPGLRASDIAILVAGDHDRYLAQVGPVLGALHRLPFHVVDAPATASGRAAEAALQLLELPLGRFTRRELLGLMTHPAVLARHARIDPADWVRWCEHLGICHGADARDHQGTYLAGERGGFHWAQGLERIALGAFVAGPRAGVDDPVQLGGRELLAEELTPDQQSSAATFALLARSLIADARWLVDRTEPMTRWAEILATLVDTYLGDVDDDDGDGRARSRVTDNLRSLADLDLDGRAVPFREVVELARTRLGALRESRGEPLAHGVMVAALEPMRPLPFAATFVVGLGEGDFPAIDRASPLDLRTSHKRGDVNRRDRDRYGFLEALLASRGPVFLSYVARDEQSGETLAPSSVIHELAEMLAPYLDAPTAAAALARLTVTHPLRRWDDGYLAADRDRRLTASASPAAARERHARAVRDSLAEHLQGVDRSAPDAGRLRQLLAEPALAHVRAALRLDLADGVPPPSLDDDAPVVLSLAALRGFLESPVQAWAKVVLRLDSGDDLDDGAAEREDEPFDVEPRERAMVLRDSFGLFLGAGGKGAGSIEDAYQQMRRRRVLASQAPLGAFGAAAERHDLGRLHSWERVLRDRGALDGPWIRLAFGRAGDRGAELVPAIALDVELAGRLRRVEVVGTTQLIGGADRGRSLVLINKKPELEHRLRHQLDHLALAAAGVVAGRDREGLVLGESPDVKVLRAWSRADAVAQLTGLAADLLGRHHAYLLPLIIARRALKADSVGSAPDDRRQRLGYGPLDRDPGLMVPPDAVAMVRRRLGPLAAHMIDDGDDA